MKIVDAYWEEVVQINCNCLGGDDYIQFQRDKSYHDNIDKEAYYVKFVDNGEWDLKTRLRTFFKYRKDMQGFIDGEEQAYNGIHFNYDQAEEFYSILYNDALNNEILLSEDVTVINSPIKDWKPEIYPWSDKPDEDISTWVVYKSQDDLVLALDMFEKDGEKYISDFKFSWAFSKKTTKKDMRDYTRRFLLNKKYKSMCQENELFLYKEDLVGMLQIMSFISQNTQIEKGQYKLNL